MAFLGPGLPSPPQGMASLSSCVGKTPLTDGARDSSCFEKGDFLARLQLWVAYLCAPVLCFCSPVLWCNKLLANAWQYCTLAEFTHNA